MSKIKITDYHKFTNQDKKCKLLVDKLFSVIIFILLVKFKMQNTKKDYKKFPLPLEGEGQGVGEFNQYLNTKIIEKCFRILLNAFLKYVIE
jgi:hypothetical protein